MKEGSTVTGIKIPEENFVAVMVSKAGVLYVP
jgi:hypothetical protein